MWARILLPLFVMYLVATAVHIGLVIAHEPFSFDAWNVAVDTGAQPPTVGRFFGYWQAQYAHANPRLGQPLTYLAYKVAGFAEIATPLAYLGLAFAITVLGLGRWPTRGRELALWAIAIGIGWFVFPQIGRNLFCRAYSANYVYTAAFQLWFLAWVRLGVGKPGGATALNGIEASMFGLVAGMCNEHTGPALVAFLFGYAWWRRRAGRSPWLAIAGGLGAAIGTAALLFAPGQAERYDGLAQRMGLLERVVRRGVSGNLDLFREYVVYAAPLLGLVVLAWLGERAASDPKNNDLRARRRRALQLVALAVAAGLVIVATLSASPKLGSRFYLVPLALLLAGFIAVLDVNPAPRRLAPFVVLGVVASGYAAVRTIPLFTRVAEQGAARMAALEASPSGGVVIVAPWDPFEESWWFIGDEFRAVKKRELVARYFGLDRVSLRGGETRTSLPALGVRVVPRYRVAGTATIAHDTAFELGATPSHDLRALHRAAQAAIERLRDRIAPATLDRFELTVEFVDARPPLPRRSLVLSRWRDGRFEAYAATIGRSDRDAVRTLALPAELVGRPFQLYLVQVGARATKLGVADRQRLAYAPPHGGPSWALACDATDCLLIAATR